MSSLGIYFGPKIISIVETKNKKVINNIQISVSSIATQAEDKVPEELKLVALFKDELRKKKIDCKEAAITLSGTDLIIRNFVIPVLPAPELPNAINFEAKKYIPFKIEELVTSYQTQLDKVNHRYSVLFIGIKKDTLEKYISILRQLNLKVSAIEYSAFSILRLVKLSGLRDRGVIGVVNIDTQEEEEADFTVIENGFPLFSRDIKLISGRQEPAQTVEGASTPFEKLKTELRISLDYYNRKFPLKRIEQIFLIINPSIRVNVETFVRELNLTVKFIDPTRVTGRLPVFSLSFLKAYSIAISNVVKTSVKASILLAWERSRQLKEVAQNPVELLSLLFSDFKLDSRIVILAGLICAFSFGLGMYQKMPLQKELNAIIASRPLISNINPQASYDELNQAQTQFSGQLSSMDSLVKKQLYLTPQLSNIPGLIPENMWLNNLSFKIENKKAEFTLNGMVYFGDNKKELESVNNLLLSLKKDPEFSKFFKEIQISSLNISNVEKKTVTNFIIEGTN